MRFIQHLSKSISINQNQLMSIKSFNVQQLDSKDINQKQSVSKSE